MGQSKAVIEAKARLADIDARIKAFDDATAAAERKAIPARARLEAFLRRCRKRVLIRAAPQGEYLVQQHGLGVFMLAWTGASYASNQKPRKAADITKAVLDGERITVAGSGINYSVRGVAGKCRYVDAATVRRIDRLYKAANDAEAKARAARLAWSVAKREAWEASSDKPTPDEIAVAVGQRAALTAAIPRIPGQGYSTEKYKRDRLADYDRPNAVMHLEHLTTKAAGACPCSPCKEVAREAAWKAAQAAKAGVAA